ncbi:MAG: hypothetical protein ABSF95_04985 [Verrucomicrobiota bacterium]|jgi:hypothetical protein
MQYRLTSPTLGASGLDANPNFNVVIAYEDFEAGKHARKTYDFLVENLGRELQFTNQMWRFDVLSIPKLRELAATGAAQADLIVISSHGSGELPGPVTAWIESWLGRQCHGLALVALFDCPREESQKTRAVRAYLAGVASRGGLEFFGQPDDWPGRRNRGGPLLFQANPDLGGRSLPALAGVAQEGPRFPRWGINE